MNSRGSIHQTFNHRGEVLEHMPECPCYSDPRVAIAVPYEYANTRPVTLATWIAGIKSLLTKLTRT